MSQRLELLNPKKTAAKPGLKFKPKAVARKSEKDRAKEAPEVKSEDRFRNPNATRGREEGVGVVAVLMWARTWSLLVLWRWARWV